MTMQKLRRGLGILGGTFDPVHTGHLSLAKAALHAMPLTRVELLPAGEPWQKSGISPGLHRLNMLRIAVECEPLLRINTAELCRIGATYTIDTVRELRQEVGPSMPLVLILGMDQWNNLSTWKDWQQLCDYVHLAVSTRAGADSIIPTVQSDWAQPRYADPQYVGDRPSGLIVRFSMPAHLASATAIRHAVSRQPFAAAMKAIDGLLPLGVAKYIREHGLYQSHDR